MSYALTFKMVPVGDFSSWRRRYEKERGRRGSRLGRWVPDPSLVTVEPGLPATFYLPRPCVADVLRLQGILCLRTRGAVGLRARVPAEVSGRDAAGGSAWSTAPTGPPGLPCEQRGAVGLRARVPAEVSGLYVVGGGAYTAASSTVRATRSCRATGTSSSRCVQPRRDAGAEPTHQLVAWLTVRTTQASSRRSNEPRQHEEDYNNAPSRPIRTTERAIITIIIFSITSPRLSRSWRELELRENENELTRLAWRTLVADVAPLQACYKVARSARPHRPPSTSSLAATLVTRRTRPSPSGPRPCSRNSARQCHRSNRPTPSTSPQPYDALCTAVLARSGNTYRPLPFTRTRQVSQASQSKLLVSSSTVPPAAPPPATGARNGLPGASPHSTRTYPASSRPPSASPLPAPVPVSVSWSTTGPSAVPSRSQSLPSSSASTPATTKATATVAPLPVAPQQAPASRPGVAQVVSASPSPRTSGAPRLIQQKQPQILPKLSSGSANMTTPSAAATTRSQSPRAAQHKATPRPAPVPAPQPATTVQRGAAMGLNTGSPLLIGNPAAAQPGMFPAGPAHGTFLLNQYIPGLGHSPILIQGALGQTQSSLGQIQGVQLALRPPHATGLTLGPQTGPRPHGGHPGPPGTPTLVIPQNLGPRPNIFLAPPRMMSPPSFAIVPGQPLTLQQMQAMLPTQTTLAQPTLGAFQTAQHQSLVQIPTFTQPQILAHAHHHHHHHHHHSALSGPLISTGCSIVSSAPSANIVTHHPVMTSRHTVHSRPVRPGHRETRLSATTATRHFLLRPLRNSQSRPPETRCLPMAHQR
ncbi:hypothetical protein HPB51_000411 [Rhipicephalus microplus]|uniref:Uncharacterized protein n=1 Tax=Rhipicephalus microplus TaxID=6941 RepID=A0A9J6E4E7_RHIMP|nr:hypothetical protein HPB51_000411 [Rhipicephalus microplus]